MASDCFRTPPALIISPYAALVKYGKTTVFLESGTALQEDSHCFMPDSASLCGWRKLFSRSPLRVYIGSLLVAILPLAAFFYYANRIVQRQSLQQAKQNNMQVAALSSLFIEDHFRQSIEFLQSYATDPKFQQEWAKQDLNAIQADMDHALELQPDMELISTYPPDGTLTTI